MSMCANWGILADKFNKRLSNWKAMSLSFGGRVTLIKSLEGIRRKFFWGGTTDENKIAWIAWDKATSSISNEGLGISTLKSSNLAMLSKWWWRFHTENHAFWCKIIRSIHGVDGGLNDTSLIKSKSGPWYRIAKLKDDLSKIGIDLPLIFKKKIGDGCSTQFWLDTWLGGSPLKDTVPRLFRLDSNTSDLQLGMEQAYSVEFRALTHGNALSITIANLLEGLNLADRVPLPAASIKFFDVVVQTTHWLLWRFRNDTNFATKRPNKQLIIDDVKLSSFNWISSRQK
ncbi:hypothetical protein Tco_0474565, partial [Tanacetum coccineum]